MYPNLYFAFKDLFGVDVPALRFVNSFGFFVALAFLAAAAILTAELKRKSKAGLLVPSDEHVVVGQPVTPFELISNFILGFVLGYKILALFFLGAQATEDPQAFIFSTQGSWPLGLGLGLLFAGMKWWEKKKQQLPTPEKRTLRIWPQDRVGEITVLALIFGLLGAKLFDIFENWSDFLQHPADYILSPAGLTFYGGLICAAIAIILFARKHKIPLRHLADGVAPALMLAYAIGRIGCQVSGDGDWGIVNNNPKPFSWLPDWMWAFKYPNNVNEAGVPIPGCVGKYCNVLPEAVYPTPFYETIMATIFFLILWSLRKKLKPFGA
ncbi:MAG TPA: prolipoprotein diacylglyceryl transferase family protein, partial [Flavisolibacter sp.]|nr:prolipoprotein diacylglyceryl transferase family protein [Flavisolibacter sp.]